MPRLALPVALALLACSCGARQDRDRAASAPDTLHAGWSTPIGDDGLSLWDVSIVEDRVVIVGTRTTMVEGTSAVDAVVRVLDLADGDVLLEETTPVGEATSRQAVSSVRGSRVAAIAGDALVIVDVEALSVVDAVVGSDANSVLLGERVALVMTDGMQATVFDAASGHEGPRTDLGDENLVSLTLDQGRPLVLTSVGAGNGTLVAREAGPRGLSERWRRTWPTGATSLVVDGLLLAPATLPPDDATALRVRDGSEVEVADVALRGRFHAGTVSLDVATNQGRLFTVQLVTAYRPREEDPSWRSAFVSSGSVSTVLRGDDGGHAVLVVASQTAAAMDARDGRVLWEAQVPSSTLDAQPCLIEAFAPTTFVATCNEGGTFELKAVEPRTP